MSVVGVRGGHQRAGIDQQHSVLPETLGQQLVSLSTATRLAGSAERDEGQTPPRYVLRVLLGETS